MKSKKYDGNDIRKIVIGMITNRTVLSRISGQWTPEGLFQVKWADVVGGWCVDYLKKYQDVPNKQIETIFEQWVQTTNVDEKTVDSVESFLVGLSDQSESQSEESSEYLIDLAGKYFNQIRYKREFELGLEDLERGDVEQAQARAEKIRKIQLGKGSYVCPADDIEVCIQALAVERKRPLVRYHQAAGEFFEDRLQRGTLFSLMAPDKTGKTSYLIDFTYRALRNRNRVAYFELGDGDQDEVTLQLMCRAARLPEYEDEYEIPIEWDKDGGLVTEKQKLKAIDYLTGHRELARVQKLNGCLRISCHENSSMSAAAIDGILADWDREDNWRPDVVVMDYADLLVSPKGVNDPLEAIDQTWKHLRRMTQKRDCLIMTATQSSSSAYKKGEKGLLGRSDFSGRKTKLAHVNGMIGINVTDDERAKHISRLNWVVRRKSRKRRRTCVTLAGNFDVYDPAIISRW